MKFPVLRTFTVVLATCCLALSLAAQSGSPPPAQNPPPAPRPLPTAPVPQATAPANAPARAPAPPAERIVVEEIVARVNNEIVTLTDLERAKAQLPEDVEDSCRDCKPDEKRAMLAEREKNALRDLIDQSLLVQKCKDLGINVESEIVRRLDEIRQRNNIATMEDLQKAVEGQGLVWEEFKDNFRRQLCTQEVLRSEVGRDIKIDDKDLNDYYEAHKTEFERPETVYLSEIFVSTVDKAEAEIPALEEKAKRLRERVLNGEDFYELAKRYSDGDTAKQGGDLGGFKRGELAKEIEETVFKMKAKQMTEVIRTKTGFLFLRVEQRYEPGIQPFEIVRSEIYNRIYMQRMPNRMRDYLARLREESFVVVKPGYVDSAAVSSSPITEVETTGDDDSKENKKQRKAEEKRKKKEEKEKSKREKDLARSASAGAPAGAKEPKKP